MNLEENSIAELVESAQAYEHEQDISRNRELLNVLASYGFGNKDTKLLENRQL